MGTEFVAETPAELHVLTLLSAQEKFIEILALSYRSVCTYGTARLSPQSEHREVSYFEFFS